MSNQIIQIKDGSDNVFPIISSDRHLIGYTNSARANLGIDLDDSVMNYKYVEIIFNKSGIQGGGNFINRIISTDSLAIGQVETISFTAYNSSSYNFYAECGFSNNTKFTISSYHSTGWTIGVCYVIGIMKK